MFKQFYLISIFLFLFFYSKAQIIEVVDKTNMQPLADAAIVEPISGKQVLTNVYGQFDLSSLPIADSLIVSLNGFHSQKLHYQIVKEKQKILMSKRFFNAEQINTVAQKFKENQQNITPWVHVTDKNDIAFQSMSTMADMLMQSGQLAVQESQVASGSPIIQGFEANKILLTIDGVRLNNAIYRSDHQYNVNTIDQNSLEQAEIMYGPNSILYGSDAMGGVLNFVTKPLLLNDSISKNRKKKTSNLHIANGMVRFGSNNFEKTAHLDYNIGGKKISTLTSVTYTSSGNRIIGATQNPFYLEFGKIKYYPERINNLDTLTLNKAEFLVPYTSYNQFHFLQKLRFRPKLNTNHYLNFQFSTSSNINRNDKLSELDTLNLPIYTQAYYGPLNRLLIAYTLEHNTPVKKKKKLYDTMRLIAAYQQTQESVHERFFRSVWLSHKTDNVNVISLTTDFERKKKKWDWRYGSDFSLNMVESRSEKYHIIKDSTAVYETRFPDGGSSANNYALYINTMYKKSELMKFHIGLRASYNSLKASFIDTTFYPFPFNNIQHSIPAIAGNFGVIKNTKKGWRLGLQASTAYRLPNVADISIVYNSKPGMIIVPSTSLKPEQLYSVNFNGVKSIKKLANVGYTSYFSFRRNMIALGREVFQNEDTIIYKGDSSAVFSLQNKNIAMQYGGSAFLSIDFSNVFSLHSCLSYAKGLALTDSSLNPLDHIPPIHGRTMLRMQLSKIRAEFYVLHSGWKRNADYGYSNDDNKQYATIQGMPGWYTINTKISYQVNPYLSAQLAVENINNVSYRTFGSGIHGMGRNIVITLRGHMQ